MFDSILQKYQDIISWKIKLDSEEFKSLQVILKT